MSHSQIFGFFDFLSMKLLLVTLVHKRSVICDAQHRGVKSIEGMR